MRKGSIIIDYNIIQKYIKEEQKPIEKRDLLFYREFESELYKICVIFKERLHLDKNKFLKVFCLKTLNYFLYNTDVIRDIREIWLKNCRDKKLLKMLFKCYAGALKYLYINYNDYNKKYIIKYSKKYNVKVQLDENNINKKYYEHIKKHNIILHINIYNLNIIKIITNVIKNKNKINLYTNTEDEEKYDEFKTKNLKIIRMLYNPLSENPLSEIINNETIIKICLFKDSFHWIKFLIENKSVLQKEHIEYYLSKNHNYNCLKILIEYIKPDMNYVLQCSLEKYKDYKTIKNIYEIFKNDIDKSIIDNETLNLSLYNINILKFIYSNSIIKNPIIYNFERIDGHNAVEYIIYIIKNFKFKTYPLLKRINFPFGYEIIIDELYKLHVFKDKI